MFKGRVPPSANTTSQESKKYNQPRNSNNQKHKRKSTHRHHSESEASKKANSFRRYVEYFESSEMLKFTKVLENFLFIAKFLSNHFKLSVWLR